MMSASPFSDSSSARSRAMPSLTRSDSDSGWRRRDGLVPADEHVVGRVEEQDAFGRAEPLELVERGREVGEEVAGAHVDDERVTRRCLPSRGELGDLADEHGRQVVDDEEAEILEHVGGFRPAGTGHAGDDRDVETRRS